MEDIVPKLFELIKKAYQDGLLSNNAIGEILKKIDKGDATYEDLYEYANELGKLLENSFSKNISDDVLPDGKMYFNIADRIISPMILMNYESIAEQCQKVQTSLNKKAKIGLKGIKPSYNPEKTKGIVNYISAAEKYSDRENSFIDSLSTYSRKIVDDSVKENAEFHYSSGLSPKIIRKTVGKCCKWCSSITGVYEYAEIKNSNIFRRHANCRCQVIYDPNNGAKKVQDVWSKKWNNKSKFDVVQKRLEKLEPKKYLGADVTKQYISKATPKKGKIEYEKGYSISKHTQEIEISKLIHSYFGGDIKLLNESAIEGVMTADYLWNGKLWDLKTVTTEKSADSAIRKGMKQILENAGGIILDYRGRTVDYNILMHYIDTRMKRSTLTQADVMIILENKNIKVMRYKK